MHLPSGCKLGVAVLAMSGKIEESGRPVLSELARKELEGVTEKTERIQRTSTE